jgi:hypothetical protein
LIPFPPNGSVDPDPGFVVLENKKKTFEDIAARVVFCEQTERSPTFTMIKISLL